MAVLVIGAPCVCVCVCVGSCGSSEFTCANHACVDVSLRCNGVVDCDDAGSDEHDCGVYRLIQLVTGRLHATIVGPTGRPDPGYVRLVCQTSRTDRSDRL